MLFSDYRVVFPKVLEIIKIYFCYFKRNLFIFLVRRGFQLVALLWIRVLPILFLLLAHKLWL